MRDELRAFLALEDGTVFEGRSFGFPGEKTGEIVFNTSMSGYQEILTDPSYKGQIVVMTYPLIGNYGVNEEDIESQGTQGRRVHHQRKQHGLQQLEGRQRPYPTI